MIINKNILLTGPSGLLGSKVSFLLANSAYNVYEIVRPGRKLSVRNSNLIELDLNSNWSDKDLPHKIDIIIHLAQSLKFRDFPHASSDIYNVNIDSTFKLLEYGRNSGANKFIYASSGGVYGNGSGVFSEESNLASPKSLGFYLGSKLIGETLVESYSKIFDINIFRFFFIYGRNQNRNMLIPRLYDSVAQGKPVQLVGANGIRINPVHVEDAASFLVKSLEAPGSITCNVAGPDVLSIREICELFGQHLGSSPIFEEVPGFANDLIGDISLQRKIFGNPKNHLKDNINDIEPK